MGFVSDGRPIAQGELLTWHVRLTVAALHILQHPALTPFSHKLPAEDTIFSKVHIGREHVCVLTVQRLSLEVLTERTMSRLVILQGVVTVRTKRTGQHSNVPKDGL